MLIPQGVTRPFHYSARWRILVAMSRRKHIPDNELPPITPSGTGAPRKTEAARARRKKSRANKPSPAYETLGERSIAAFRRLEPKLRNGFVPGNPGNSGGKKGRSGRRPDIWLAWCQKLMLNNGTQRAIRRVIRDRNHPAYGTITKMIRDSAFPTTKNMDLTVKTSLEDILAQSYKKEATSDA